MFIEVRAANILLKYDCMLYYLESNLSALEGELNIPQKFSVVFCLSFWI